MVLDDLLSPTERCERRKTKHVGAPLALDLPQALQHELQVGRLDPRPVLFDRGAATDDSRVDPACGNLTEDRFHEGRFDLDAGRLELVVPPDRSEDGRPRRLAVEQVEAQVVREETGDASLEDVEPRELVVADAEHDVDPQAGPGHELREQVEQASLGVVEEQLLELVEDEQQLAPEGCGPGVEAVGEVAGCVARIASESICERAASRLFDRSDRVAGPGAEICDREVLRFRERAQRADHTRAEQRRLADAARAVEDRQPGRECVGGDDLGLALASEEEEGVELALVERAESLVRRAKGFRDDRHLATPSVA